jgi:peptide/nickel transport system substrate-binding protein
MPRLQCFARNVDLPRAIARRSTWAEFWPVGQILTGHARHLHIAVLLALALSAALLVAGCRQAPPHSRTTETVAATRGGHLIVNVRTEPQSFSWYTRHDGTTQLLTLLTQARLVRVNRQSQVIEPWLAESWTRSEDGLRYTLKLRPNVAFADGHPFTADDVVFSFRAAYAPNSALADSFHANGKRLHAKAVTPTTVEIVFPGPFGPGLRLLDNLPILPKHKLQDALDAGAFAEAWGLSTPLTAITGLGPFVLSDYAPGQRMVFTRNDRYFRRDADGTSLPYLDRITVEIVPEQDAQILRLQTGQSDMPAYEVRPEDYAPLKRAADKGAIQLIDVGPALDADGLWFNLRPNAFKTDARAGWIQRDELRQAISLAVDRQAFADTVFLGAATPVFGPITPTNKLWYSDEVPRTPHDLARAKSLLATIGLEDRNGDGLLENPQGTPARFTLLTQKGQTALERGAAVIRDHLKPLGLTVNVVALEGNALVSQFLSGKPYDAVYFHLSTSDTDPALNADFWMSSGGAHVWNPGQQTPSTDWERKMDEVIERHTTTLDERERQRVFTEAQKIFAEHLPMVHFAAPRIYVAATKRVKNLTPTALRPQLLWSADTIAVTP